MPCYTPVIILKMPVSFMLVNILPSYRYAVIKPIDMYYSRKHATFHAA